MEKFKQISVIFATIAVIFINFISTKGYIGGVTPEVISNKYPTFVTPAGYAFSIWGLIYFGLILFTIYQAMPAQIDNFVRLRGLYILSCVANCAWIFLWHNQLLVASVGAIVVLLVVLGAINFSLSKDDSAVVRVPFGIYFGWITVATIANIAVCLTSFNIEVSIFAACILISIATIAGVFFRLKLSNAAYGLAITWAITAIAVKHGGVTSISLVSAIAVITLLIAVITPFLRLHEAK
ncbi:MAG: tryptophan-rich sensory protein [Pyrinomonadaceae bacterium]|nr:tryptophan-rich sensory protein [Pyrinomonadaceae bacterium]